MQPVNREGTFRIVPQSYSLFKTDNGAVAVNLKARIIACWEEGEWKDWEPYECEVDGSLYVVKNDGKLNTTQAESLIKHAGWDGKFDSITEGTWKPLACGATVKRDSYRSEKSGEEVFSISWINSYEYSPGGGGNVDAAGIKELNNQYGSQLRALAGSAKANGSKPSGKPPAPPNPNRELSEVAADYDGEEDFKF